MQVVVNLQAMMSTQILLKALWVNNGQKLLISRRASSRKTPETASAAENGLHKRLTVLLLIQGLGAFSLGYGENLRRGF